MPVSSEYLEYILDQLSCIGGVDHKRMFGGIGLYFDGLFFGLLDDDEVYFKVDDSTRVVYESEGARGFDPYKDGRASLSYYSVPVRVLEDADTLRQWAIESVRVARNKSKPEKTRKATAKKPSATENKISTHSKKTRSSVATKRQAAGNQRSATHSRKLNSSKPKKSS